MIMSPISDETKRIGTQIETMKKIIGRRIIRRKCVLIRSSCGHETIQESPSGHFSGHIFTEPLVTFLCHGHSCFPWLNEYLTLN